jgi:uncharacterized protein YjiK/type III secretory pathway component EscR
MPFISGAITASGGSYTPASGTDTMLVVVSGSTGSGLSTASSQDFGGSPMSEVNNSEFSIDLTGSGDPAISSSYLINPGTTSQAFTLSWTGTRFTQNNYAFTVSGVNSVTGESGSTYTSSTNPSLTYSAENGDTVVYVRHHARGGGAISWTSDPTGFTRQESINLVTSPARRTFAIWTRDVTSTLTNETAQAVESAAGDGDHGIFVIKAASPDVNAEPNLQTLSITSFKPFVLASNIASLINTINNYSAVGSVASFAGGGTNTSDATYRDETGELITIRNGSASADVYDLGVYGTVKKTISLTFDGSDCEGICDMGLGEFATCSEDGGRYQFNIYDWPSDVGTAATSKQEFTIAPNGTDNNSGAEGICYDRKNKIFYIVGEGEQTSTSRRFFKVLRPGVNGRFGDTSTSYAYNDADDGDGWSLDDYISEPFDPEVAFSSYGASGATFDLSSIDFDHASDNVVITSDTGQEVLQVDPSDGTVIADLSVTSLSQMEGVAILPSGDMMLMGEADEYIIYEAAIAISASFVPISIAIFNPAVEISSPLNVDATSESLSIAALNPAVEVLVDLAVAASLVAVAITPINPNAEVLTNTNINSPTQALSIQAFNPSVDVLTNLAVEATVESLAISLFNPSAEALINKEITATVENLSLAKFNPDANVSLDLSVTATLETIDLTAFNPSVLVDLNITTNLVAMGLSAISPAFSQDIEYNITVTSGSLSVLSFDPVITIDSEVSVIPALVPIDLLVFNPSVGVGAVKITLTIESNIDNRIGSNIETVYSSNINTAISANLN